MTVANEKWLLTLLYLIAANLKGAYLEKNRTVCETWFCQRAAQNLRESINPSVDPCENFYNFACGNWGTKHPARTLFLSSSTLLNRVDVNNDKIIEFLSKSNNDEEPKAVHKARHLFSSCLDTASLDKNGLEPLLDILKRVGLDLNSTDEFDLIFTITKAQRILGKEIFFATSVGPDPYNRQINRISILQPVSEDSSMIPSLVSKLEDQYYESLGLRDYIRLAINAICENLTTVKCQQLKDSVINETLNMYSDVINSNKTGLLLVNEPGNLVNILSQGHTKDSALITSKSYTDNSNKAQIMTLAELQNITNAIALEMNSTTLNWTRIIELTFENTTLINWATFDPKNLTIVAEMTYLKEILPFILDSTSKDHEIGITWKIIDELAYYTAAPIRHLKQNYSWELQYKTREEWCALTVSHIMGKAVSYYYATNKSSDFIKAEVNGIVEHVHRAFKSVIQSTQWMDDCTKLKAINKTNSMKLKISFSDKLKEKEEIDNYYSDFKITNQFLDTVVENTERAVIEELYLLNSTNDLNKDREALTPVMVNAFYDPEENAIIIPAGILGFPLCGNGVQSLNYGAIGSVLGHEITHGFDNKGRQYNYIGNLEEWWDDKSLHEFQKKTQCFKERYSLYTYEQEDINVKADGIQTLPENIADNGGFKSALLAYRKYLSENEESYLPQFENYTHEQLFTLGFAQVWCEQPTLVTAFLSLGQDHSPNIIRVNGVLMNSKEFPQIWHCPKGSGMNPSEEKCELW